MKVSDSRLIRGFARVVVAAGVGLAMTNCAAQQVTVSEAWARATVAGQKTAGAYAEMTSTADAVLVAAASPAAERVEIHSMTVEGGVMRMRAVQRVALPARQTVRLAPGGLHLMLIGINRPLKIGDKLPLVLTFELASGKNSSLQVDAEVRAVGATGPHRH